MNIWSAVLTGVTCCGMLVAQTQPSGAAANVTKTNAKVGEMAPDFTLHSTTGKDITLSDYRGKKNVALAFIVKAFTGG